MERVSFLRVRILKPASMFNSGSSVEVKIESHEIRKKKYITLINNCKNYPLIGLHK